MRPMRSISRGLLLLACMAALFLAGCGGGGSSSAGAGGDGDGSSGPLTVEQRNLATGRVAERLEQIAGPGSATPEQWEQLRAWVLTQPEFIDAGVGDQTLWARFRDGRYFLYTDNWKTPPASALQQQAISRAAELRKAAMVEDIPKSADAVLLGLLADEFSRAVPVMAHMEAALKAKGWDVAGARTLTIASLKAPAELGFLFLTAHAGVIGPTGAKDFAVITEDQMTEASDKVYSAELDDGAIIYNRDRPSWRRLGFGSEPHYAVTSKFVAKYLNFSPESLVILVACHTGSPEAAGFRDALFAKGAGTIVGWDGSANPYAYPAMDLMVDRLSGANAVEPVTPPNRPFRMSDVWSYLGVKGHLLTPPLEDDAATPVRSFGTGFTMLNPIITDLQVMGTDKLIAYGEFGRQPATVSVGGRVVGTVVSPDGKELSVPLASGDEGEVLVTARKRTSNRRVLTSWRGQVTYSQLHQDGGCEAAFSDRVTVDLHLRGDGHGVRDTVDGPIRDSRLVTLPSTDTRASWKSEGQCSDSAGLTARWTGQGNAPITYFDRDSFPTSSDAINLLITRIDAVEQRIQLTPIFGRAQMKTQQYPGFTQQWPLEFDYALMGFFNTDGDFNALMPWGTSLPFDSTLLVPAGQHQAAPPEEPSAVLTVKWGTLTASPPFDDTVPR